MSWRAIGNSTSATPRPPTCYPLLDENVAACRLRDGPARAEHRLDDGDQSGTFPPRRRLQWLEPVPRGDRLRSALRVTRPWRLAVTLLDLHSVPAAVCRQRLPGAKESRRAAKCVSEGQLRLARASNGLAPDNKTISPWTRLWVARAPIPTLKGAGGSVGDRLLTVTALVFGVLAPIGLALLVLFLWFA
jgi:hypothetical protein